MPDGDTIQFKALVPFDVATLQQNVNTCIEAGYPYLPGVRFDTDTIHIYANGPSLKTAPQHRPSMVLNGAIRHMSATYWVACDPQPLVADFLTPGVTVLNHAFIASKCDPSVFEKLHHKLGVCPHYWHLGDESTDHLEGVPKVPTGVSVTLCAIGLAHMMGYRDIHVYGWDGCYDNEGNSHASPQGHSREGDVEVEIGSGPQKRVFKTTHSWALEAQNAVNYVQQFDGLRLTIHGNGLMANVLGRM